MSDKHFNGLDPAEQERLMLLSEQLAKAQEAIAKIIRHGYDSTHPEFPGPTNRAMLQKRLGGVRHAMIRLCDANDLSKCIIHEFAALMPERIKKYLHHQE